MDQSAAYLRSALEQQTVLDRKHYDLAVEMLEGSALIGAVHVSFATLREADIGYSFHASHWGKGLGTEAAKGLLRLAFSRDGVLRVKATVGSENHGSIRVLEKIGMRREAFFPNDVMLRDRMRSSYVYSYDRDCCQTLR